ncbi:3-methyladenine DNA glycosylase [Clavibacter sp. VKM Ac-2542]|uniref:3-methyladenine DNA glycosylase n=1 Tax=Clavibacter sp. VKM Ac-2542 TaxID=2783811 RepID=UPI00188B827C|nr:3-methyladenine DNA glycosylase [Clavibacter sp. VKM Ac-2542]MBF4619603.1 3-methyladenine DNA glycosylase [Clavibacter sp. VKM Ac-2542]
MTSAADPATSAAAATATTDRGVRHLSAVVGPADWRERAARHADRADAFSAGFRARRLAGRTHEVDDFLFTYYPHKPSLLRRWHPGAGVVLADAAGDERAAWRWYVADEGRAAGGVRVDASGYLEARGSTASFIERILGRTAARPGRFSCFGLHEWAMVYKVGPGEQRHERLPLRLGSAATDEVVETHRLACTHIDAFRFFTPEAVPRNALAPTRETQPDLEQPGCLHAGMDVYKWATKLGPLVPGETLLDAFELARDIRSLDMRASPYDVSGLGLEAVRIEEPAGKARYAAEQRGFAERSNDLRTRILDELAQARRAAAAGL